jgi:hypothetical protein
MNDLETNESGCVLHSEHCTAKPVRSGIQDSETARRFSASSIELFHKFPEMHSEAVSAFDEYVEHFKPIRARVLTPTCHDLP